jgi:hypothetical protein
MLDQELFGPAVWQQCEDRHAQMIESAAACRVIRRSQNGRPRHQGRVGARLGTILISVGLRLGGRVRHVGRSTTLPAYQ